ncbi:MAG: S8 family peptidase [Caulobacterales bacterium]
MRSPALAAVACLFAVFGVAAHAAPIAAPSAQEKAWSTPAAQIGLFAPSVWAGPVGGGVTIAIIDTGIRATHQEFNGAGKIVGGYDAITGVASIAAAADTAGHGTHVASLAAGEADGTGMMGAAPFANILAVKVFAGSSTSDFYVARGLAYARASKAFVFNMSLEGKTASTAIRTELQSAVTAGKLVVIAAGNDGAANPSWPARHASEAWAKGQLIAVGAVDSKNVIASFSNRAGDAKNFFLVAPGVQDIGAYPTGTNTYAMMSGTSMAAPIVAGAAATVKSKWPFLGPQSVAGILFASATDLGAAGIDPIYGRGLVNLERAMQPSGTPKVLANGTAATVKLVYPTGSVTVGPMVAAARGGVFEASVFDDFGRDFAIDLGQRARTWTPDGAPDAAARLSARLSDAFDLSAWGGPARVQSFIAPDTDHVAATHLAFAPDGAALAMSNGAPSPLLGRQALAPLDGPAGPALAFAGHDAFLTADRLGVAVRRRLADGLFVTFGAERAKAEQRPQDSGLLTRARPNAPATAFEGEVLWLAGRGSLGAAAIAVSEPHSRLGDAGAALAVEGEATTQVARVQGAYALSRRITFAGAVSLARTDSQRGAAGSLADGIGETDSVGYAIGLAAQDLVRPGDRLDLSVGAPLAAARGEIETAFAIGADPDTGAPIWSARRISLASQTPEMRLELGYARPAGARSRIGLAFTGRDNADGVAGAREMIVATAVRSAF